MVVLRELGPWNTLLFIVTAASVQLLIALIHNISHEGQTNLCWCRVTFIQMFPLLEIN